MEKPSQVLREKQIKCSISDEHVLSCLCIVLGNLDAAVTA